MFRLTDAEKIEKLLEKKYHKSFEYVSGPSEEDNHGHVHYTFRCLEEPQKTIDAFFTESMEILPFEWGGKHEIFVDDFQGEQTKNWSL